MDKLLILLSSMIVLPALFINLDKFFNKFCYDNDNNYNPNSN